MSKYQLEVTEEELRAIGLICSYFKYPHPLYKLENDIAAEFGNVDFGELDFDVYMGSEEEPYRHVRDTAQEVIIRWPKDWEKAWHSGVKRLLRRN